MRLRSNRFIGLTNGHHGLTLTRISSHLDHYSIDPKAVYYFQEQDLQLRQVACKDYIQTHDLSRLPCHYILDNQDYDLISLEVPHVDSGDFMDVIRWKVKGYLSSQINRVEGSYVIDAFRVPQDAHQGQMTLAYVVIADKAVIKDSIHFMRSIGLSVRSISIPEIAIKNLISLINEDSSVGVLMLDQYKSSLILIEKAQIYFIRGMNLAVNQSSSKDDIEMLADSFSEEIQKDLDYYENQIGKDSIRKIFFFQCNENDYKMIDLISEKFNYIQFEKLEINKLKHKINSIENIEIDNEKDLMLSICSGI